MHNANGSSGGTGGSGAEARHYLSNERLIVELADVQWPRRPRFDRTGFITQVTLKDHNRTYCAYELDTPDPDAGGGLCGEFGIMKPVGYGDAEPGEWFPKLGVGLLKKEDGGPYDFTADYGRQPFEIKAELSGSEARYAVLPKPCGGYAAAFVKTVTLSENTVLVHYLLTNCGEKRIDTHEYIHNFMRVDDYPIGPGYSLRFMFPFDNDESASVYDPAAIALSRNEIRWLSEAKDVFYFRTKSGGADAGAAWELRHEPSGARVREELSLPLEMAAVWGRSHVVSPEMFAAISLEPGETVEWTRKYLFE